MVKEKKKGEVKLYGEIYPYGINSAADFIARFDEARKGADEVNLLLHTQGGDVQEGTLIYNHIKGCGVKVNVIVAGVSCSMGTVIMMAAAKVDCGEWRRISRRYMPAKQGRVKRKLRNCW